MLKEKSKKAECCGHEPNVLESYTSVQLRGEISSNWELNIAVLREFCMLHTNISILKPNKYNCWSS